MLLSALACIDQRLNSIMGSFIRFGAQIPCKEFKEKFTGKIRVRYPVRAGTNTISSRIIKYEFVDFYYNDGHGECVTANSYGEEMIVSDNATGDVSGFLNKLINTTIKEVGFREEMIFDEGGTHSLMSTTTTYSLDGSTIQYFIDNAQRRQDLEKAQEVLRNKTQSKP